MYENVQGDCNIVKKIVKEIKHIDWKGTVLLIVETTLGEFPKHLVL